MPDSITPTFRHAYAEYVARYEQPALAKWDVGKLSQALLIALGDWSVALENISLSQAPSNAAEVHTRVELFDRKVTLEVGIGQLRLAADDPTWDAAETLAAVLDNTIAVIREVLGATVNRQVATIAFHFSVKDKKPADLIRAFINPQQEVFGEPGVTSFGVSVYRENGHFVLDTSLVFPDALFMRISRLFPGDVPLRKLGESMYADEARYLASLGLAVE